MLMDVLSCIESTASICSATPMSVDLTTAVQVKALIAAAPVGSECFKSHVDVSAIPAATAWMLIKVSF